MKNKKTEKIDEPNLIQIPIAIQSAIKICFPIYFHNFKINININISDIMYIFVFFKKKEIKEED